jgi:hypothetical protein
LGKRVSESSGTPDRAGQQIADPRLVVLDTLAGVKPIKTQQVLSRQDSVLTPAAMAFVEHVRDAAHVLKSMA